MTREQYIAGLRATANFYEDHPEVQFPQDGTMSNYRVNSKEDAVAVVKALGSCEKQYEEGYFRIVKEITPEFFLRFVFNRSSICERVKVAEKVIPAHILAAREETIVPEKVEEVFEWRCPGSLLEGAQ